MAPGLIPDTSASLSILRLHLQLLLTRTMTLLPKANYFVLEGLLLQLLSAWVDARMIPSWVDTTVLIEDVITSRRLLLFINKCTCINFKLLITKKIYK